MQPHETADDINWPLSSRQWDPEDIEIPDWHCAHHGEMGMGPSACKGCRDYW